MTPDRANHPGRQVGRQQRLFAPLGMHKGSPSQWEPENWMQGRGGATVAWHSTGDAVLPAYDDPERNPFLKEPPMDEDDYEESEPGEGAFDSEGRRMAEYGSAIGLHFGSKGAAIQRAETPQIRDSRVWAHPVEIDNRNLAFRHGGPWTDKGANYSERATDLVEEGKVLPYRNEVEDTGSTSYRAQPQAVRTWGESVMEAHAQHTGYADRWGRPSSFQGLPRPSSAQVAAAQAGYNPVIPLAENRKAMPRYNQEKAQPGFFHSETYDNEKLRYVGHHVSDSDEGRWRSQNGYSTMYTREEPNYETGGLLGDERHAALSQVQFRRTGLRE